MKTLQKTLLLALVASLALAFSACSYKTEGQRASKKGLAATGLSKAPSWFLLGGVKVGKGLDPYSAVGSARIVDNDMDFARSEALSNARGKLAARFSAHVKSVYSQLSNKKQGSGEATLSKSIEDRLRVSIDLALNGSMPTDTYISDDGSMLAVLIQMTPDGIADTKKALKRAFAKAHEAKVGNALVAKLGNAPAKVEVADSKEAPSTDAKAEDAKAKK